MLLGKVRWRRRWAVPVSPVFRCTKRASKGPQRDDAMKGRTVTTSSKWSKETARSNGRKWERKEECLQSTKPPMVGLVFPPVSHTKWLCICHHAQIPLHGRFAISPLEVKEDLAIDFHNLHHKAHTNPVVPGIFTTGDSDLLGSPTPPPQSFCTTWLSRLNTGSSTSLVFVLHKLLVGSNTTTSSDLKGYPYLQVTGRYFHLMLLWWYLLCWEQVSNVKRMVTEFICTNL